MLVLLQVFKKKKRQTRTKQKLYYVCLAFWILLWTSFKTSAVLKKKLLNFNLLDKKTLQLLEIKVHKTDFFTSTITCENSYSTKTLISPNAQHCFYLLCLSSELTKTITEKVSLISSVLYSISFITLV